VIFARSGSIRPTVFSARLAGVTSFSDPDRATNAAATTATRAPAAATARRGGPRVSCRRRGGRVRRRRWQRCPRGLGQLRAGLPAIVWVLGQGATDHRVKLRGQAGPPVADPRRLVLEVRVELGDLRRPRERHLAGETLEQHAAERVHVRPPVHPLAADSLRREVGTGPEHARLGQALGRLQVLGDPEVDEVDALVRAVCADQGIARLVTSRCTSPCSCAASSAAASWATRSTARSGSRAPSSRRSRARSEPST
jgi:hypothetical protein